MEEVTISDAMLEALEAYGDHGHGHCTLSPEALWVLMEAAAPDLPPPEPERQHFSPEAIAKGKFPTHNGPDGPIYDDDPSTPTGGRKGVD